MKLLWVRPLDSSARAFDSGYCNTALPKTNQHRNGEDILRQGYFKAISLTDLKKMTKKQIEELLEEV